MAKKHLEYYFLEQEQQYLEMLDNLKELDMLYKEKKIPYERYSEMRESFEEDINEIKMPYELLSYVMFLMNIPNKPKKGKKYETQNKLYFSYLEKFKKENWNESHKDILANFKNLVKEYKKESNNK